MKIEERLDTLENDLDKLHYLHALNALHANGVDKVEYFKQKFEDNLEKLVQVSIKELESEEDPSEDKELAIKELKSFTKEKAKMLIDLAEEDLPDFQKSIKKEDEELGWNKV